MELKELLDYRVANRCHHTMLSVWINIGNGKGSSSWVLWRSTQTCCHIYTHKDTFKLSAISAPPFYIAVPIIKVLC